MIFRIGILFVISFVFAFSLWAWASATTDSPMGCVDEISFPVFDSVTAYHLPASVHVRVSIGSRNGEHSVTLDPPNTPLKFDLMEAFNTETRYSASCKGRVLDFDVRYLVQGERTRIPVWQVRFRPPSDIIVVTHPLMPSVN